MALELLTSKKARKLAWLETLKPLRIAKADTTVVSYPKSGRTWLRAMMTRLYQQRHSLPEGYLLGHGDLERLEPSIPRVFFTHDCNPLGGVKRLKKNKRAYRNARVVFLARHPLDVVVSHYHQIKYRRSGKRENLSRGLSMFNYAIQEGYGLATIIQYMNIWRREVADNPDRMLMVKYEDLRAEPATHLGAVMQFLGSDFSKAEIRNAVEFASFENLKKLESSGYYKRAACARRTRQIPTLIRCAAA